MSRISQLTELTTPHDNDLLPIVDVSDTTQASSGSTKYIKVGNLPIQSGVVTDADLQAALANSPALGGTPTAPTAFLGTNTTQIATTAFVVAELQSRLSNINGGAPDTVYSLTYSGGTP
jgi:hypothetical protein